MRGAVPAVCGLMLAAAAFPAAAEAACSIDAVERDPASVIAPCGPIIAGNAPPAERAMALRVRAEGYIRTGRLDLAAADLVTALALKPDEPDLLVARARVDMRLGDAEAAAAGYDRALTLDPEDVRALVGMGGFAAMQGTPEVALVFYDEALRLNPDDAIALLDRSTVLAGLGEMERAMADADRLAGIPPEIINRQGYVPTEGGLRDFHVLALVHRGNLRWAVGDLNGAGADFDAAVAYKSTSEALTARARFRLDAEGRVADGLADLDEAVAAGPQDADAHFVRGVVLAMAGDDGRAIADLERTIELAPGFPGAYAYRARILRQMGRRDDAIAGLARGINVAPGVIDEILPALRAAGYWEAPQAPEALTPELYDAVTACMVDPEC